ncbi:MAG: DUF6259 domain-containing protein [Armatimonadota bacterium]
MVALLCATAFPAVAQTVLNGSFEIGTPGYGVAAEWSSSYHFYAGIAMPDGKSWFDNGATPDGRQVAFIQTNGQASLSQQINGLKAGKKYWLQYSENSRQTSAVPLLTVSVDAVVVDPAHAVPAVGKAGSFTKPFTKRVVHFSVPSDGDYTLTFRSTSGSGDSTLLLDNISIVEKPGAAPPTNLRPAMIPATTVRAKPMKASKPSTMQTSLQTQFHRGRQCLVFDNGLTALYLDAHEFTLVDLVDRQQGISYVVKPGGSLFSANYKSAGRTLVANGACAKKYRTELVKSKTSSVLRLKFTGCPIGPGGLSTDAVMSITLKDNDPLLRFGLELKNFKKAMVREIAFPTLTGLGSSLSGSDATDYMVAPGYPTFHHPRSTFDSVVPNLAIDASSTEYPGGMSMQMLSYSDGLGRGGLYLAAEDASYSRKYFESRAMPRHGSFMMKLVHYPDGKPSQTKRVLPYQVAFGPVQGDWYDAGKIYRKQLLAQGKIKPIAHRHDIPDWFLNTHVWYQGQDALNGYDHMAALSKRLTDIRTALGMPYGFHLYLWWKGSTMATGFPDYFPAIPGFGDAVTGLRAKGVELMPYIDMEMFDTTISMWKAENAQKWASRSADGKLNPVYTEMRPNVNMCESTAYWQDKMVACMKQLVQTYGVRSIYLDELYYHPPFCTAKNHAHTDIGGSYLADGFRKIIKRAKAECGIKQLVLTGEHSGETYADLVAGGLSWASVFTDIVPIHEAVLKDCSIPFGQMMMSTDLANMDSFAAKIGFQLVGGRQLGWINLDQGDLLGDPFQKQMAFLKSAAQCRASAKDFVLFGEYLRPPDTSTSGMHTVGWSLAPINVVNPETNQVVGLQTIPKVMASAYRAVNGDIGIVLVNVTNTAISASVPVNEKDWGLRVGKLYESSRWADGSWSAAGLKRLEATLPATIPAYSALLIRLHRTK